MKTNAHYLVLSLFAIISFHYCNFQNQELIYGDGNIVTEKRTIKNVNTLVVYGSHDVKYLPSKKNKVEIEIDDNLTEHLLTETDNGKLRIKTENNIGLRPSAPISITVHASDINAFFLRGSGSIDSKDVETETIELDVTGSGDISVKTSAREVSAGIIGSGDIKILGTTDRASFSISGSGDINAFELEAQDVEAKISGSGDLYCKATKSLTSRISGSGDVIYDGKPTLKSKINGSGTITPKK